MGLFDKIKNIFGKSEPSVSNRDFEDLVHDTWQEYPEKIYWAVDRSKTTAPEKLKSWTDKKRVDFAIWLVHTIHHFKAKGQWESNNPNYQHHAVRNSIIQWLFRNKLTMDDKDIARLYEAFSNHRVGKWAHFTSWPIGLLINQVEKQAKYLHFTPTLIQALSDFKKEIKNVTDHDEKARLKLVEKIDAILFAATEQDTAVKPARFPGNDSFADMANAAIEQMPEAEKAVWYKVIGLAQKASGSKPTKKYLDEVKAIIKESDSFKKTMHQWLQFLINLKESPQEHNVSYSEGHTYSYTTIDLVASINADMIKALVWACSHFHDNTTIQLIAGLAERAFRKIPGKGPTALSIGNACLYVLYKSKGLDGIGQLSRLRLRIKQASTQNLIDKYLQAAAKEQGVTVGEVEDMAVDDCGLENGSRTFTFDDYKAELVITGVGKTDTKWFKPDGSPQKSVPAIIKEKHAAKLKKLKDIAKQVEQTLTGQRDRLDRMLREDRKITWDKFEQYFLQHGLLSWLTNKIIWNFHKGDNTVQAIHLNNYWVNATNEIVPIDNTESVSLWHPVQTTVDEIKAWRDFFVFHQLQQPFKQAYREVYLLTDAEANTRTYSNRMAAHILRQHQFNSLAKSRGWRYALSGAFDSVADSEKASLTLPQYNLRAEYWVTEVNADDAMSDSGIWNYISTDQVRFINTSTDETVQLVDIPPLVFSEVMRDVDLFVGVASVGNDPQWRDTGGLPAYRDYWTSYSFGELSEVAKSRKEILSSLVPRLKIKDIATIKDKFLVVKGKLRTYKIHIGSTNILMEPNDQYLCIVPDRSQKSPTENVFLPFEGDNGLSIILSKAFLLAEDDKITDSTITSQIKRK